MAEFNDKYPNLPQAIDIGGDRYFMGPQKPIELGFKSRKNYIDTFGDDAQTEYLLRRYMYYSLHDKRKLSFDSPNDKASLIAILKKRATQLEASKEFTSSMLKNTIIQRSFINIQRLIQQLEGPDYKGFELPSLPSIPTPFGCEKAKKYIKQIPDDKKFHLMLEIAWYLLHPDDVPSKAQCNWANLIKQLDTLRIGDIVANIHKVEQEKGIEPSKEAFNYFKKINLETVAKAPSIQNALQQATQMATQIQDENSKNNVKERLKTLLDILEMKKYLSGDLQLNENKMKIIDVPATESIKKSMSINPMAGGASKTLDKPLGIAMKPLFDYFKVVYDPIYSLLESSITSNSKGPEQAQKAIIPQLTTLLHICNNLNPSESKNSNSNTYGIYRVTNIDGELVKFINNMLAATQTHLEKFQNDKDKNTFDKQLFELPKVRLSTLLNKFLNSNTYKDPDTIPYIQFFTVGGNMELMEKDKFMDPKHPEMTEQVFNAVTEFFTKDDIYILCTKSDNITENIPMNLYQVDYDSVDVGETGIKIDNIPDNYFNKLNESNMFLEKLVTITPYVVYNDAELALSIFIAFKELMPK